MRLKITLFAAAALLVADTALASTFTSTSPTGFDTTAVGVSTVGGLVVDLFGTNTAHVISQSPASSLYQGYFNSNPGTIGTQTGFGPSTTNALGGGLQAVAFRFSLSDGDTAIGEFDYNENILLVNGLNFGNWSSVITENTDGLGNTGPYGFSSGGFRDDLLDTGWFFSDDPTLMIAFYNSLLGSNQLIFQVDDADYGDNYFDFAPGIENSLLNVGQPPIVIIANLPADSTGYWDINGDTVGAGGTRPNGSWQEANWSTSPDGSTQTLLWTDGADANFSAGNDATGQYTVDLDAPVIVRELSVENGQVTIAPTATLNHLTFTDPRDGESTITTGDNSLLALNTDVLASGNLTKTGDGRVDFNAPTVIDGIFSVHQGTVNVNSSLVSVETDNSGALTVNGNFTSPVDNNGFLGGSGLIKGNVQNVGIVSPGNSIGELTIDGSYTHSANAIYLVEISADGRSDLLNVSGSAVLNGGIVRTSLPQALYTEGFSWDILTAGAGITGNFASVQGQPDSESLDLILVNGADNGVDLQIKRTSYGTFGNTLGQQATGAGLDMVVPMARNKGDSMEAMLIAMDFGTSAQQIGDTLTGLSPEMYTSFSSTASQSAQHFAEKMASRSSDIREKSWLEGIAAVSRPGGPDAPDVSKNDNDMAQGDHALRHDWTAWGYYNGILSDRESSQQYLGYDASSNEVFVGLDREISPKLRVGISSGTVETDLEWQRPGDSGDQKSFLAGVYASLGVEGYYADTSLSFATYSNEAKRVNPINSILQPLSADFDGQSWLARLGLGYDFFLGGWSVGPTVSLSYLDLRTDDFQENEGGYLSMNVDKNTENRLISSLGVRVATLIQAGGITFLPRLEMTWKHDEEGDEHTLQAAFHDYPSASFSVPGAGVGKDILSSNIGVVALISETLSGHVQFESDMGDDYQNQVLSVGITYMF